MYDLDRFTLKDMTECGATMRKLGDGCHSMEEVAQRSVSHLYQHLGSGDKSDRACVLAHFFVTQLFGDLTTGLQRVVHSATDITLVRETPCLTMLGSIGSKPEWCRSDGAYKAEDVLALPDPALSERYPVVAQLIARFDLPGAFSVPYNPDLFVEEPGRSYDVFYLPDVSKEAALFSTQEDFFHDHKIKSVVGFGGLLPSRNLFAIIVYSNVPISKQVALAFRPFALNTKIALLPFDDGHPIFSSQVAINGKR
jgi:two-component system, NtrC family, sensor kinase